MTLLWYALFREALKSPWQLLLTILSIAAGVAVVVGVDIANSSALSEFDRANSVTDGLATHRIVGSADGFDEDVFKTVRIEAGIREAAPVVAAEVTIGREGRRYELLGVDPISDFRIRALSNGLNNFSGENAASTVWPLYSDQPEILPDQLGRVTVFFGNRSQDFSLIRSQNTTEPSAENEQNRLLVTDISWAQVFLQMQGKVSRIELRLDREEQVKTLESLLPPEVRLIDVQLYNGAKREMTKAFRINLMALGMLALVIAMFLIYSSVSFQIVRRRKQIGLLRLAGVTSGQLAWLLMLESMVFALVGVSIGLIMGYVLAIGLHGLVTGTINALYFSLSSSGLLFTPLLLLKASALGIGATLLSSAAPIVAISRQRTADLLKYKYSEESERPLSQWLLPAAVVTFLLGILMLLLAEKSLVISFAGLFLLICAMAVLTPWVIDFLCGLGRKLKFPRRGLLFKMVLLNTAAHQRRTAVAVAALSVAVSATLGVALMIDSFRFSVEEWLEGYLRSDIYISSQSHGNDSFSKMALKDISNVGGVRSIATGTRRTLITSNGPLTLFALETNEYGFAGFQIKEAATASPWKAFEHGEAILISEPFSNHNQLKAGDVYAIPTDKGDKVFPIAAVYRDYSSDRGLIAISRSTYSRYFDDQRIASVAVVVEASAEVENVLEQIKGLTSVPNDVYIRSNRALKDMTLKIFDQTFRVTEVLRWLAIVVSVIGIISALMALQLERSREYATLKAVGFSHWQLGGQILLETGMTGLIAGLMAVPLGMVLALSLIEVINVRSYGWSMQTVISIEIIVQSILLAVVAALIAGVYPAWRLWRTNITAGLRDE
ncbi:MAG: FtsX-like permease family protein [Acidiferrobacterales bacterium]|nr:FtsX-like permease family protein [Acidiferrobacterales bacterium]